MPGRPYAKVLDRALQPRGFVRSGLEWVRLRGDLEERVELEPSRYGGRTVSLNVKDLETEKLYLQIFASEGALCMPPVSVRLGLLIDNRDRWWGDEPDGPQDMAEMTVRFGVPWFDRTRTLEEQAADWYGRRNKVVRGYFAPGMIGLALTLYRMGELAEACAVLSKPPPRTARSSKWADWVERTRVWLGCASPS